MLFMKGTPSAPQCGFSRQLVSILRENQVKYGYVLFVPLLRIVNVVRVKMKRQLLTEMTFKILQHSSRQ